MSHNDVPVVWITGASRGIGAAIARAFAETGARVVLTGRNVNALRKNAAMINQSGGQASWLRCDVSSEKNVSHTAQKIAKRLGKIDVLVNNAGVTYFKPFLTTTARNFDRVFTINLRGAFLCIKAVLPAMVKRKEGFIINIGSVSATTTFKNSSVYASSKAGLLAMSRGLRIEVRKLGIRVIDILPGAVETEMWDKRERKKYGRKMMQPEDVAEVVISVYRQPRRVMTEEIIVRPIEGDI